MGGRGAWKKGSEGGREEREEEKGKGSRGKYRPHGHFYKSAPMVPVTHITPHSIAFFVRFLKIYRPMLHTARYCHGKFVRLSVCNTVVTCVEILRLDPGTSR